MKKPGIFICVLLVCMFFSAPVLAAPKNNVAIEGVHTDNKTAGFSISGQEIEINKSVIDIVSPEFIDVRLTLKSHLAGVPKTGDPGIGFLAFFMAACCVAIAALLGKKGSRAALSLLLAFSLLQAIASIPAFANAEAAKPSYEVTEDFSAEILKAFTFEKFISNDAMAETIRDSSGSVTGITWKTGGGNFDQSVSYRLRLNENVPDELFDKRLNISKTVLTFISVEGKETVMEYPDVSIMLGEITAIDPEPEIPLDPSPEVLPTEKPTVEPVRSFDLIYSANGGTGDDIVLQLESGTSVMIADNTFERLGYLFASWNTQPDGTGDTYMPGNFLTITDDLTLYAQWKSEQLFVVVFVANGGVPAPAMQTVEYGGLAIEPADPARSEYVFYGWYPSWDFSGDLWDFDSDIVKQNMILYARWVLPAG